jgi:hypothetical protein
VDAKLATVSGYVSNALIVRAPAKNAGGCGQSSKSGATSEAIVFEPIDLSQRSLFSGGAIANH